MTRAARVAATRVWRLPFLVAAVLLLAAGAATSLGFPGLVQALTLTAVMLAAAGVLFGTLALTHHQEDPS